jgi:hypothetical protein
MSRLQGLAVFGKSVGCLGYSGGIERGLISESRLSGWRKDEAVGAFERFFERGGSA